MSSQVTIVQHKRSRKRWAAIGFLLIVSLLIISLGLADPVRLFMIAHFKGVGAALKTVTPLQQQAAFTLAIFVVLGLVAALIVTLAAPKKAINVREKDLVKERTEAVKYQRKVRKRQRKLNREMREYVEKNQK